MSSGRLLGLWRPRGRLAQAGTGVIQAPAGMLHRYFPAASTAVGRRGNSEPHADSFGFAPRVATLGALGPSGPPCRRGVYPGRSPPAQPPSWPIHGEKPGSVGYAEGGVWASRQLSQPTRASDSTRTGRPEWSGRAATPGRPGPRPPVPAGNRQAQGPFPSVHEQLVGAPVIS